MYLTPSLLETSLIGSSEVIQSNATFSLIGICQKVLNLTMLVLTNQNMKKEHAFSLNIQQVFDSMSHVFWYGKLWTKLCMVSIKKKEIIQFFLTNSTDFNIKSNPLQYHTILSLFLHTELFFRQSIALMRNFFTHRKRSSSTAAESVLLFGPTKV